MESLSEGGSSLRPAPTDIRSEGMDAAARAYVCSPVGFEGSDGLRVGRNRP